MDWAMTHELMYGMKHSAAEQADRWNKHCVFVENYRCIALRTESGVVIAEDIMDGL